jgi:CubicO group peptidase (beta-lactamase class C family)
MGRLGSLKSIYLHQNQSNQSNSMNTKSWLFCSAFFLILMSCNQSKSQTVANKLDSDANKITFSNTDFQKNSSENKFIDTFKLNEDTYLNIHFDLDEPLVAALKKLDPSASDADLISRGNYQFTFLVDDKALFTHNLNPGAGTPESKQTKLSNTVPLVYPERIDYWGWYLWLRFSKMGGGEDALASGTHDLTIEIRSYLNGDTLKVGDLLAVGNIPVDVKEIPYDTKAAAIQPIKHNSGWNVSKDTYDVSKIETLNKKIAQNRFIDINSIVVIKNNELLIEEYFNGANRETLHNPRSVGKTIASTMMGIAIEEGHLKSENQKLNEFYNLKGYKNYDPIKEDVTLKSLLTMSSPFVGNDDDYDSPGNEENMYPTEDWVKFTLDLPMSSDKVMEKDFEYFTAGIVVLGDIIHKSVPGGLVKYTDEKLFEPMGITKRNWQFTPQNVGNTAGGLQLRSVDFAKWGQIYKNKGQWEGQQLIPEAWVEKSLDHQVTQENVENGTYGYLFWNNSYSANGKEYGYSSCSGNGGNKIYVFKDIPLVVVITASAYGMPYAHLQADQIMERYILPAVF